MTPAYPAVPTWRRFALTKLELSLPVEYREPSAAPATSRNPEELPPNAGAWLSRATTFSSSYVIRGHAIHFPGASVS
ncbi:MAG TPA: hypothetical protein VGG15_06780, partial [Terriglobales bacterium]